MAFTVRDLAAKPLVLRKRAVAWWTSRWFIPVFILPALVLYVTFVILPLGLTTRYSFFHWDGIGPMEYAGLSNFVTLFDGGRFSQQFAHAFRNTLLLFLGNFVMLGLGLVFALALHSRMAGANFYKVVLFLPVILAGIATSFLWRLMLDPNVGAVNWLLRRVGLGILALPWLGDRRLAIWIVVAFIAWHWTGFNTLVFLANLQAIPREMEEAAAVDGASYWQRLLHVIIPQLRPAITILTVLTWAGSFQTFAEVVGLFNITGGDWNMADVVQTFIIRKTFGIAYLGQSMPAFGQGAAVITVVAVLVLVVAIFQVRYLGQRER
jgi:raffinose/stachyose/melibiose transport system permease protein